MSIFEKLSQVLNLKLPDLLSTMSSDYTKRFVENKYDDLMQTNVGAYLKNLPRGKKHLLEMILYFFSGLFEQKFEANSPLKKYFKEVLSDSASEISKRMMNGIHEELQQIPFTIERRTLMDLLCDLDEATLKSIIEKLYALDAQKRKVIMREFEYLNPEKFKKVANMSAEDFQKFSGIFQPKKGFWKSEAASIKTALQNYVNSDKEEKK